MKSISSLVVVLLLAGCGAPEQVEEHDNHAEEVEHEGEEAAAPAGMVRIDPEMLRDLRITTTNVESRAGGQEVTVLGEVGVNEDAYAEVGCPVEARVTRPLVSLLRLDSRFRLVYEDKVAAVFVKRDALP